MEQEFLNKTYLEFLKDFIEQIKPELEKWEAQDQDYQQQKQQ